MSSSNSFSSVHSNPSASMPYEIEDELLESDFEVDREGGHIDDDSDMEAYFDEPISNPVPIGTRFLIGWYSVINDCRFISVSSHAM